MSYNWEKWNEFSGKRKKLNEAMDLSDPIKEVVDLLRDFENDIHANQEGSTDAFSVEYEGNDKLYNDRYKALVKWEKNVNKALKRLLSDYKKVWK
tara:strand:- start:1781 stop:2065 length:285 start_codon:yes stop_codon:yes gene_type:complete